MSRKSMMKMKRDLAEVIAVSVAHTFCLSYPDGFPPACVAKEHFIKLQRWVYKKFGERGMFWKREPQKRGATHYHVLAFLGEDQEEAERIGGRILRKWCDITTGGDEHQLRVHLFKHAWNEAKSNFQRMRGGSFFNYLGKYLSKDNSKMPEGYINEGGGRWWGHINRNSIPYAEKREAIVADSCKQLEKSIMRILYKLRQNRAQVCVDALHHVASNPRTQRDQLARAIKVSLNLTEREARKAATHMMFRLDGSRRSTSAPIKARKLPRYGAVTFLGSPDAIKEMIGKFLNPKPDYEARKRIFSDDYQPPKNENNDTKGELK